MIEDIINSQPADINPYRAASVFYEALRRSAKSNIPRGRVQSYKPFWNSNLTNQKKIGDKARTEAERTQGKTLEKQKEDVIKWRKE